MSPGGVHPLLAEHGLNMQAVFDIAALPVDMRALLKTVVPDLGRFTQLHLFGQGGRTLWTSLQQAGMGEGADPVDDYAATIVRRYFDEAFSASHALLFPHGDCTLPLQGLGGLAGWHHESPFKVGINGRWGPWFAYRAAALADTHLPVTSRAAWGHPCPGCTARPCIQACPASALATGTLDLDRCIDYRLKDGSYCVGQCLARIACPVAPEHRYSRDQIRYHYGRSLVTLRAWREKMLDQPRLAS